MATLVARTSRDLGDSRDEAWHGPCHVPRAMTKPRLLAVSLAWVASVSGCLASDDALERGWGHPLAVLPGEDGNVWGVYADSELAASTAVAMVEWQGADPSGRNVQGGNDEQGVTTVTVETSEGPWSAAVDPEGQLVWADPLPADPTVLAGAIGDAGMAAEDLAAQCETCSAGIGPLAIIAIVVVVGVAATALWTAWRDPPNRGEAKPAPGPGPTQERRRTSTTPSGGARPLPAADCGPEPTGDIRKDPAARRRHFEYLQCLARAGASR